jgi:hypothetical protein
MGEVVGEVEEEEEVAEVEEVEEVAEVTVGWEERGTENILYFFNKYF